MRYTISPLKLHNSIVVFCVIVLASCSSQSTSIDVDETTGGVTYSVSGAVEMEVKSAAYFRQFELFDVYYWELVMESPAQNVLLSITISGDEPINRPKQETYFIGSTLNQSEVFTAEFSILNPNRSVAAKYTTQFTDLPFGELTFSVVEDEYVRGSFFFNAAFFNPISETINQIEVREGVFLAFEED